MPTLQALGDGYQVYVVTDASGGVSREGHDMGVQRMVQAGAVSVTYNAILGDLQRDWARQETLAGVAEVVSQHGGGSAIAFAWETQLLATPTPEQAVPAGAGA
jgi:hypothetical protein